MLDLEKVAYIDLTTEEKTHVSTLDLNEDKWDCFVNHYNGFYWSNLEDMDVAVYWKVLGWSESSWDDETSLPDTEDMTWDELSSEQQEAAYKLCYFDKSWDWVVLSEW